jgi:hypothetical protein
MRTLKPNEIEVRVGTISEKGASLLLYKNARVDMLLLDETFGEMNWKREHRIVGNNNYCTVSVYNKEIGEWVSKEDCGVESYTEKEKGESSDSFKRACVNWGIGRELYTAGFLWVSNINTYKNNKGKIATYDKFKVDSIAYNDDRDIIALNIVNQNGVSVLKFGLETISKPQSKKTDQLSDKQIGRLMAIAKKANWTQEHVSSAIKKKYGVESKKELNKSQYDELCKGIEANPKPSN